MSGLSPSAFEVPLGPGAPAPAPLAPLTPLPPLLALFAVPLLAPLPPLPLPPPLLPPLPLPLPPPPLVPPPPPCANAPGAPDENSMETRIDKKTSTCARSRAREREARRYRGMVLSPICRPARSPCGPRLWQGPGGVTMGRILKVRGETPRGQATGRRPSAPRGPSPSRSGSSLRCGRGEAREDPRHW